MQVDVLSIVFSVAILTIIFSPFLFRKEVHLEDGRDTKLWVHLFSSKWFGATFVFVLLFGNYSEFTFLFVMNKLASTLVVAFFISVIGNSKLLFNRKNSTTKTKNAQI
ncbi:hypothetical protein DS745_02160 [Anaerobacillus alkaliphilus]|uniref:Uncharacterized protein n=1 Tax=Anaerobacillus alkaliphilus TaxID=1548597 RepID=A0A4Q0VXT2_9BACI|nr:hypothetical protein [Anaerobacillus alkaliphilus]RXJ04212.1 hypothetical protein DS745_02160 [Anaerobacillus alkaliphilus]